MADDRDARWARFLDSTEAKIANHDGFIRHEATAIEREVAYSVKHHLVKAFPGFTLLSPTNFPRFFNNPWKLGEVITELDGVYILSNDPEIRGENVEFTLTVPPTKELRHEIAERSRALKGLTVTATPGSSIEPNRLVIIEAKHHVTRSKIETKLNQMKLISQYLEWARDPPQDAVPKFKKNVEAFGFNKYSTRVYLYIGGVYWEEDAVQYVQQLLNTDVKEFIGVAWPSGMRYDVFDMSNMFGKPQAAPQAAGSRTKAGKKKYIKTNQTGI